LWFLWLKRELEEEAKKPAGERTSEPDTVVDLKNQSIVQTIHTDNRVSCDFWPHNVVKHSFVMRTSVHTVHLSVCPSHF